MKSNVADPLKIYFPRSDGDENNIKEIRGLPNLDLIRTFAVIVVIFYHLYEVFVRMVWKGRDYFLSYDLDPLGRAGVLLFFVHTSFVLMRSIERSEAGPIEFYLMRAFRIFPLSIACVVVALFLKVPRNPYVQFEWPALGAVLSNILLSQNVFGHVSILNPMWSLPYEVQMYMLLPLVFLIIRDPHSKVHRTVLICVTALLGSLIADKIPHGNLLYFIPCFMAGVLAYALLTPKRKADGYFSPLKGTVVLILVTGSFVVGMNIFSVPTWSLDIRQTTLAFIMCTLIGILIPHWQQSTNEIVNSVCRMVSKYSYGIYLTHQTAMWISFVKLDAALEVRAAIFVFLLVLLPFGCFHLVERPMIFMGRAIVQRFFYRSRELVLVERSIETVENKIR